MGNVVVDVMLKPEILDPQGQAVAGALPRLGLRPVHRRPAGQALRARASTARSPTRCSPPAREAADDAALQPGHRGRRPRCEARPERAGMRIGVVTFPGSLDDRDAARAVRLAGAERGRALARRRRPARGRRRRAARRLLLRRLPALRGDRPLRAGDGPRSCDAAQGGLPVLGICNGFQVLCESHLLPGALIRNDHRTSSAATRGCGSRTPRPTWTSRLRRGPGDRRRRSRTARAATSPTSGRSTSSRPRAGSSSATVGVNPNGSYRDIAGITNARGNVVGLMPHPEHPSRPWLRPAPPTASGSSPRS